MKLISFLENSFSGWGVFHHSQVIGSSHSLESCRPEFALNPEWIDGMKPYFRTWQSVSCPCPAPLSLTDNVAMELLVHCAQEMNHLAGILPELYSTFGPRQQA